MTNPTYGVVRSALCAFLTLGFLLAPAAAQRRQDKPKPLDFEAAMAAAQQAFEREDFAAALHALQLASRACQARQRAQILAAMPDLPGFTKRPQAEDAAEDKAVAAALGGLLGGAMQFIEQEYTKERQSLTIKVTPSSPLVGMMKMMISNPAMLAAQKGQELIEYEGCKAILDTQSKNRVKLTVLAGERSTIEVESRNMTDEEVLKAMSQEHLTALLKPLAGA